MNDLLSNLPALSAIDAQILADSVRVTSGLTTSALVSSIDQASIVGSFVTVRALENANPDATHSASKASPPEAPKTPHFVVWRRNNGKHEPASFHVIGSVDEVNAGTAQQAAESLHPELVGQIAAVAAEEYDNFMVRAHAHAQAETERHAYEREARRRRDAVAARDAAAQARKAQRDLEKLERQRFEDGVAAALNQQAT